MLALMVCLAVACKSGRGGGYDDDEEEKPECFLDRLTDEELNSFNPNIPLTEGSGQSEAFTMHPLDELVISAPAGAFEQNPNIQVSVADGEQLQMLDNKLQKEMPAHQLVWGYDIDAGLPSDSVLPGKFTVEIDLKKLGIPKQLYPYVRMVRMDNWGNVRELNTRIKKGTIHYDACQNSVLGVTLTVGAATLFVYTGGWVMTKVPNYQLKLESLVEWTDDLTGINVNDPSGNFAVMFRFGATEEADRYKAYKEKGEQLENRLNELKEKGEKEYDKAHPAALATWLEGKEARKQRNIGRADAYNSLVQKDTMVQRLQDDPDLLPPQSVQDIIRATRLANQFSIDPEGLGLKPLSYKYNVFIRALDEDITQARCKPIMGHGCFLDVNHKCLYTKAKNGKWLYNRNQADALSVTMAHEIGHIFEMEYVTNVMVTNHRFMEAIGSVTEHWFAEWAHKKGYITDMSNENLQFAKRDNKQMLCWTLAEAYPEGFLGTQLANTFGGYMLGDLIQYLYEHKKKVTFDHIMKNYSYDKTFVQDLKDIFGFIDHKALASYFEKFCWAFMPEIVESQRTYMNSSYKKWIYYPQVHTPASPILRFKILGHNGTNTAQPFAVNTLLVKAKGDKIPPYNLFAVPSEQVNTNNLRFSFLEGDSMKQPQNKYFLTPCADTFTKDAYATLFYYPNVELEPLTSNHYIDVVALYQPKQPKVLGLTKDGEGLNVHTGDEPAASLLQDPENPYVTGMQMVVINNKTKKKKQFNVPLEQCGQEVKIPFSKVGITDPDDIDVSVRTRWYYDAKNPEREIFMSEENKEKKVRYYSPATERVNYKKQKEQEKQEENKEENENDESFNEPFSEDVSQDLGEVVIDAKYPIDRMATTNVMHGYWLDYTLNNDGAPIYAHIVVKGRTATITIPTHSVNKAIPENRSHANYEFTGFTIKCKCRINRETDAVYAMFESLESVSPSSSTKTEVSDYWQVVYDPSSNPDRIDTHFTTNASSTIQFKTSQELYQKTGHAAFQVHMKNDRSMGAFSIQLFVHEKYHSVTKNTHWPDRPAVYDGDEDTYLEIKGVMEK